MFDYLTKKLDNGLRLVFVPTQAPTIISQLWVAAGSKYEQRSIRGLAHFLEHLAFKGSKKRPTPLQIAQELDRIGASYNASTSKERITYWLKTLPKHLEFHFDFLADIVFQPLLKPTEIERERGVIIEELNMYQDTPMAQVGDLFERHLFGDNPLGWEIIGTKKTIKSLARADFLSYQKRFFYPGNMVLVVVGGLKKDNWPLITDLAQKYFSFPEKKAEKIKPLNWQKPKERVFWQEKKTEQVHLFWGRSTFPIDDPRRYCLKLLAIILAGNTSSRLWQLIRERHGWAYYLHYLTGYFQETGFFALRMGLARGQVGRALKLIRQEVSRLSQTLTKKELDQAKEFWLGRTAIDLETPDWLAEIVGSSWLLEGRITPFEEIREQILSVSLKQARRLAEELFQPDQFYLAAIGPKEKND